MAQLSNPLFTLLGGGGSSGSWHSDIFVSIANLIGLGIRMSQVESRALDKEPLIIPRYGWVMCNL